MSAYLDCFVFGVIYTAIAARVMIIEFRTMTRIGRKETLAPIFLSIIWPLTAIVVAAIVLGTGEAGIFDSQHDERGRQ